MARRRNDAPWRRECIARRGHVCRSCGATNDVQVDHVMPRGQGGPSVVENGLVLCGPWSTVTKGGCHYLKTITDLQIRREWLDDDQIAWLAEVGWVTWGEDGVARGRGWKHFADVS